MRSFIRVNQKIRVPKIRCIGPDGGMLGVMTTQEARVLADQNGLDLVEISPNADPPVCRIMDFGKFRYEESRKEKMARKHQHGHIVKEMKFHANVAEHDYETKVNHIREFLQKGYKIKVTLAFRGREGAHKELGFEVMNRVLKDCETLSTVDMPPKMMGRIIISMLSAKAGKSHTPAPKPAAPPAPKPAVSPAPPSAPAPAPANT